MRAGKCTSVRVRIRLHLNNKVYQQVRARRVPVLEAELIEA